MASHKRSAKQKQIAAFTQQLENQDLSWAFEREAQHVRESELDHDRYLQTKACTSKNRYMSKYDAEVAILACAEHGTPRLRCYKCKYCNGWHLTSKPQE